MDALKNFLEQIKRYDDFRDNPERTARLVERMRAGDGEAEWELILSTLKFVVGLATAHSRRWNAARDLNDLVQEAGKKISAGIRQFDPARSSLKSFIRFRAKFAFTDYFYRANAINKTGYRRQVERIMRRARAALASELRREPTARELASQLEMDERRVQEFLSQNAITFVDIGEPEDEDGLARVPKIDPASGDRTPFELAELAEVPGLAERCLGRRDAELLLIYITCGVVDFQALYLKYKRKQISAAAARKYKERQIKRLRDCLKRMSGRSAPGGNHGPQKTPSTRVTQRIFNG